MAVSHRLENYLSIAHIDYQVVPHSFTETSYASACSAHVPAARVVKAVILRERHGEGYAMALIPATHKLQLAWLPTAPGEMELAREKDFRTLFPDCAPGAVPGFGQAFHMDMVWDEEFLDYDSLYFEAGDHQALIEIGQADFRELFGQYPHSVISLPDEHYFEHHGDEYRGGLH